MRDQSGKTQGQNSGLGAKRLFPVGKIKSQGRGKHRSQAALRKVFLDTRFQNLQL